MQFREYENSELAHEDGTHKVSQDGCMKGKMIHFLDANNAPHYEYMPIGFSKEEDQSWSDRMIEKNTSMTWIRDIYWKLEVVSCILVEYNPQWCKAACHRLAEVWDTICKERISGFQHRAPRKRKKEEIVVSKTSLGCLLNVSEEGICHPTQGMTIPVIDDAGERPSTRRKIVHIDTPTLSASRIQKSLL
jgi:hypothetical protein